MDAVAAVTAAAAVANASCCAAASRMFSTTSSTPLRDAAEMVGRLSMEITLRSSLPPRPWTAQGSGGAEVSRTRGEGRAAAALALSAAVMASVPCSCPPLAPAVEVLGAGVLKGSWEGNVEGRLPRTGRR